VFFFYSTVVLLLLFSNSKDFIARKKGMDDNNKKRPFLAFSKKYRGHFMVRVSPELHRQLVLEAAESGKAWTGWQVIN
jgi:hypothetical protein